MDRTRREGLGLLASDGLGGGEGVGRKREFGFHAGKPDRRSGAENDRLTGV